MNFAGTIELDEELSKQMNKIDWWNLSEAETQSLGLSIGMLNEAQVDVKQSVDAYKRSTYLNWVIGFICIAGLLLKLPLAALIVGITAALLVNTVVSRVSLGISASTVEAQRTALFDEIKQLSEDHPASELSDENENENDEDDEDED